MSAAFPEDAAENSLAALLTFALNHVREAVFLIDGQARFHYVNQEASRLLGYSVEELLSLSVPDIDPDFSSEHWAEHWAEHCLALMTQSSLTFESRHRTKDGRVFPVELNVNYVEYEGQSFHLALARDITERQRMEQERLAHLHFFEGMDRVNRAIQGTSDQEQMLGDVLDTVLELFSCDRAFLVSPCDADVSSWQVLMERSRPECVGTVVAGTVIPITADVAHSVRNTLAAPGPVSFGPGNDMPLPDSLAEQFGVRSMVVTTLHPKGDTFSVFGVHQCSSPRVWTTEEKTLLREIGRRVADGLTGLSAYRTLRRSEERFRSLFENSPVSIWEEDLSDVKSLLSQLSAEGVEDIEAYLQAHPAMTEHCLQLIRVIDVNQAAVEMHAAGSKEELIGGVGRTFTPESHAAMRSALCSLWQGETEIVLDTTIKTLQGKLKHATLYCSVCAGSENTLSRVLVSLIDITEHRRAEDIRRARLALLEYGDAHSVDELLTATLDHIEGVTGSTIGFYHFLVADQETISLQTWSTNTLETMCTAAGQGSHYDVAQAGVWVDCLHQRRPVIHNDYASLPHRKGMPPGHAQVVRELVVPVFRGQVIKAIVGIGNKPMEYDENDVATVSQLADLSWDLVERQRAAAVLRRSEEEKSVLTEIAAVFLTVSDEDMYESVVRILQRVLQSPLGLFGYIDDNGDLSIPSLSRSVWNECAVPDKSIVFPACSWGDSLWGKAIRARKGRRSDGPFYTPQGHIPITCFLAMPLVFGQKTIGLMSLANKAGGYTEDDEHLLERIAAYIAPILNARLQRDRQEQQRLAAEQALHASEEKFLQAQKMEAVGQLAGGVAHDFNNIICAIQGYCELILTTMPPGDAVRADIVQIKHCAERSASLTRQLLAFSRRQMLTMELFDLNEVLTGFQPVLARLIGEDIELKILPSASRCTVEADRGQIEQVIMNLAVNARDAMPAGGRLTLETALEQLDEEYAARHVHVAPGPYVMLAVSDTGQGMDQETQRRIFEPFFTTKEAGKGTGLGLATVYGIVRQSGGNIWVYSEPRQGTTFKLYLPYLDQVPTAHSLTQTVATGGAGETILVVEDEESLRRLVVRLLQGAQYSVLAAADGAEALALCGQHPTGIDLVITDVIMPKMGGRELVRQLAHLYPGLKTLYMSGYTSGALHEALIEEGKEFLQKPFALNTLLFKVRATLDKG